MLAPGEIPSLRAGRRFGGGSYEWASSPNSAGDSTSFYVSSPFPDLNMTTVQWQDSSSAAQYATASSILRDPEMGDGGRVVPDVMLDTGSGT